MYTTEIQAALYFLSTHDQIETKEADQRAFHIYLALYYSCQGVYLQERIKTMRAAYKAAALEG